jgi:hypothetical protein
VTPLKRARASPAIKALARHMSIGRHRMVASLASTTPRSRTTAKRDGASAAPEPSSSWARPISSSSGLPWATRYLRGTSAKPATWPASPRSSAPPTRGQSPQRRRQRRAGRASPASSLPPLLPGRHDGGRTGQHSGQAGDPLVSLPTRPKQNDKSLGLWCQSRASRIVAPGAVEPSVRSNADRSITFIKPLRPAEREMIRRLFRNRRLRAPAGDAGGCLPKLPRSTQPVGRARPESRTGDPSGHSPGHPPANPLRSPPGRGDGADRRPHRRGVLIDGPPGCEGVRARVHRFT